MAKDAAETEKPKAAPRKRAPKDPLEPVTMAERGLLEAVKGDGACSAISFPETDRVVRPSFLRALLSGEIASVMVGQRGLLTTGLVFSEKLDLSHLRAGEAPISRLVLNNAVFDLGLSLADAHLRALYIIGSKARGEVDLDRLQTAGDLWLDKTIFEKGVSLTGAIIGGDLSVEGAKLHGATDADGGVPGPSLNADRLVVSGSMFCRSFGDSRFEANGGVRLAGATIDGQLSLTGAKLRGPTDSGGRISGPSLTADGVSVAGGIFCGSNDKFRFETEGEVRLLGAIVGGTLEFDGAILKGAMDTQGTMLRPSLNADGISVTGDIFCRRTVENHFEAEGQVRLLGAIISGQLDFSGAKLKGAPNALSGHRISVGDATFMEGGFEADGSVILTGAKLTDVFARGTFRSTIQALDLSDATVRRLAVELSTESRGEVVLEGATAETFDALDLRRWGGAPADKAGVKLDLDGFTYRRAEISTEAPKRNRTWARFLFRVPIAENVLEVMDRGFEGCTPKRDHFYPQPFEQAAKVLRDMGHARAADDVAVAKREFERVCKANDGLSRFLALLHMIFFRYGYGPMRAAIWTGIFLVVGATVYWLVQGDGAGMFAVGPTSEPQACAQTPLALALDAFLPLVDLHVEDKCRWGEAYRWRGWAEGFRIGYSLIGLVFIPMVTLTFAGVFRKD